MTTDAPRPSTDKDIVDLIKLRSKASRIKQMLRSMRDIALIIDPDLTDDEGSASFESHQQAMIDMVQVAVAKLCGVSQDDEDIRTAKLYDILSQVTAGDIHVPAASERIFAEVIGQKLPG